MTAPAPVEVALPAAAVPVVLVVVPDDLGVVELAVHHRPWGVEVDVRPAHTQQTWRPLTMLGGSFTTRPA